MEPVAPAQGEARGWVDEFVGPLDESRGEGVEDGHFSDGLGNGPDHGSGEDVFSMGRISEWFRYREEYLSQELLTTDEQSSRTTVGQTGTTTQPKTHTNGRAQGDHGNMATAQPSLQLAFSAMVDDVAGVDIMVGRRARGRRDHLFGRATVVLIAGTHVCFFSLLLVPV